MLSVSAISLTSRITLAKLFVLTDYPNMVSTVLQIEMIYRAFIINSILDGERVSWTQQDPTGICLANRTVRRKRRCLRSICDLGTMVTESPRYLLFPGKGVCVGEPRVLRYADSVSLPQHLRLGVVTCPRNPSIGRLLQLQSFEYWKTTVTCKSRNLHRRCSIAHRSLQMLSYKPIIRYTYKVYKVYCFVVCSSAKTDLLPARLLLQRLLPVLDVVSNDLSSLVSGEVAADGLDEVALGVYT